MTIPFRGGSIARRHRDAILWFVWFFAAVASVPVIADPPARHPLEPTLELARRGHARIAAEIQDYTCLLLKRERIGGKLNGPEVIFAKVRHEQDGPDADASPFSVYMKFLKPSTVRGREILFAKEQEDSELLVRKGGRRLAFLTASLPPQSPLAMQGNLYPITEFGIKRLIERMIELGEKELAHRECEVTIDHGIQVDQYRCTRIEVKHPVPRDWFEYHVARIYIDDDLGVPVQFESFDWPESRGDPPVLKEQYAYRNLKLNVGLTDDDFDPSYSEYGFQ